MKEGGKFFAIALFLLVLFYGYIESQGGMKGSANLAIAGPAGATCNPCDYHQLARQDAMNAGINPDLYERQINQESGFNPNAVSPAGAIGISQIMESTASSWHVDPWNPVASLSVAADHMHWYYQHYGNDYSKALAAYNCGTDCVNTAVLNCGSGWRTCVPAETQNYIRAIMG